MPPQLETQPAPLSSGEQFWKWSVRVLGLLGFVTLLVVFATGREVPTALIVLIGGMIGLEPLVNWQKGAGS